MNQPLRLAKKHNAFITPSAFTIIELLVVIVVIAILAAITIVAYSGVTQQAVITSLKSDLSNASTALKSFQVEQGNFPTTISTDCVATPDTTTNKCLRLSGSNTYVGYSANNSSIPKTFILIASNSSTNTPTSQTYKITDSTPPTQQANTMQPGTTPGAILELHAAKANSGTSQGINSPLTTTWSDTSGNNNNGTLVGFSGTTSSGYAGTGTSGDPWRVVADGVDDYVSIANPEQFYTSSYTIEISGTRLRTDTQEYVVSLRGSTGGTNIYFANTGAATGQHYGSPGWKYPSFQAVPAGQFHLVMTYDGSAIRIYKNGVIVGTPMTSEYVLPSAGSQLALFKIPYGGSAYWSAEAITTFRFYPFALSASQVAANYTAGPAW